MAKTIKILLPLFFKEHALHYYYLRLPYCTAHYQNFLFLSITVLSISLSQMWHCLYSLQAFIATINLVTSIWYTFRFHVWIRSLNICLSLFSLFYVAKMICNKILFRCIHCKNLVYNFLFTLFTFPIYLFLLLFPYALGA